MIIFLQMNSITNQRLLEMNLIRKFLRTRYQLVNYE